MELWPVTENKWSGFTSLPRAMCYIKMYLFLSFNKDNKIYDEFLLFLLLFSTNLLRSERIRFIFWQLYPLFYLKISSKLRGIPAQLKRIDFFVLSENWPDSILIWNYVHMIKNYVCNVKCARSLKRYDITDGANG